MERKHANLVKSTFKGESLDELTHRAKRKSMVLLEEQGISVLALIMSKTLIDLVEHPEKIQKMM